MLRDALSELYKYVPDSERVRRRPGRVILLVIKTPANNRWYGYARSLGIALLRSGPTSKTYSWLEPSKAREVNAPKGL